MGTWRVSALTTHRCVGSLRASMRFTTASLTWPACQTLHAWEPPMSAVAPKQPFLLCANAAVSSAAPYAYRQHPSQSRLRTSTFHVCSVTEFLGAREYLELVVGSRAYRAYQAHYVHTLLIAEVFRLEEPQHQRRRKSSRTMLAPVPTSHLFLHKIHCVNRTISEGIENSLWLPRLTKIDLSAGFTGQLRCLSAQTPVETGAYRATRLVASQLIFLHSIQSNCAGKAGSCRQSRLAAVSAQVARQRKDAKNGPDFNFSGTG